MIFENACNSYKESLQINGFSKCLLKNYKTMLIEQKIEFHPGFLMFFNKYGNKHMSKKDLANDLEKYLNVSIIKAQSLGAKRGKYFEIFAEELSKNIIGNKGKILTQSFPEFMKFENIKSEIDFEIPDIIIESENFNAVIAIQCDLWNGGHQSNRGEKYHSTGPDSLYEICKKNGYNFYTLVSADPKESGKSLKSRGRKIIEKGRKNGILLWPSDLIEILRNSFHEKI